MAVLDHGDLAGRGNKARHPGAPYMANAKGAKVSHATARPSATVTEGGETTWLRRRPAEEESEKDRRLRVFTMWPYHTRLYKKENLEQKKGCEEDHPSRGIVVLDGEKGHGKRPPGVRNGDRAINVERGDTVGAQLVKKTRGRIRGKQPRAKGTKGSTARTLRDDAKGQHAHYRKPAHRRYGETPDCTGASCYPRPNGGPENPEGAPGHQKGKKNAPSKCKRCSLDYDATITTR